MNEKTFWSILGVLLVGWLVLFFVLIVNGQMKEYSEASTNLEKKVKDMKKFAGMGPEQLPTEDLLAQKNTYIEEWEGNVKRAQNFFESRENIVMAGSNQSQAVWIANYRDQFSDLSTRYRDATGLPEDEEVPFKVLEGSDFENLDRAERIWRVQKLIAEATLAAGGIVADCGAVARPEREKMNKEDPRTPFEADRVTSLIKLPASEVTGLIAEILGHSSLNLEVEELVVGKDSKDLVTDIVIQLGENETAPSEPHVMVRLRLNVLKYAPAVAVAAE